MLFSVNYEFFMLNLNDSVDSFLIAEDMLSLSLVY